MRILMVHNRYQAAGGEDASTEAQVKLLRDVGHEVEFLTDSNDRIAELGNLRTAARSIWSRDAKSQVGKILGSKKYDIMHVQNYFPLFSPSIYYAAHDHGVPVVQSLRNFRAVCPEGMLFRDDRVCQDCVGKTFALPAVVNKCYRDSAPGSAAVAVMSTGHRLAGTWKKRVARYVTPSAYAREIYVRAGWDHNHIDTIPNFVYPDPGEGPGRGGYALYAGRLAPPKGVDLLLEAWTQSGCDVPLKIAGEGPLKHLVTQAAASNRHVEFLGQVDSQTLAQLVGDAMFTVVPTRGIETFGRVAAESLARGTPVVAADHGGLSEIVTDGKTGFLFPPGDLDALVTAIRALADDPDRARQMRPTARDDFVDRFRGERVLQTWLDLYGEVAGGG